MSIYQSSQTLAYTKATCQVSALSSLSQQIYCSSTSYRDLDVWKHKCRLHQSTHKRVCTADGKLETVKGSVELRRVTFAYPERPKIMVFQDFDLVVDAGRTVALCGQSGSGKSSIVALILRFYDPSSGAVSPPPPPPVNHKILHSMDAPCKTCDMSWKA